MIIYPDGLVQRRIYTVKTHINPSIPMSLNINDELNEHTTSLQNSVSYEISSFLPDDNPVILAVLAMPHDY